MKRPKQVDDAIKSLENWVVDAELNDSGSDHPGASGFRPVLLYVESLERRLKRALKATATRRP